MRRFLCRLTMPKKRVLGDGAKSGNTERHMSMAFAHLRQGKSLAAAIKAVPGPPMSRNGLSKQCKKHQGGSSLPAPVQDTELPSWGANLAAVRVCSCFGGEETSPGREAAFLRGHHTGCLTIAKPESFPRQHAHPQEEGGTGAGRQGEATFDSEGGPTSCVCCACKGK